MDKSIIALGLMSGTSMDGIDASLIRTDGEKIIDIIGNLYLRYDSELKNKLHEFTKKINSKEAPWTFPGRSPEIPRKSTGEFRGKFARLSVEKLS